MGYPLIARHIVDFASVVSDWNRVNVSVGPSGDVIILALRQQPNYRRVSKGGASFAKSFVDQPNNFRIYYQIEDGWGFIDIAETRQNIHFAQPLSGGNWLLVRARSADNSDGNGHIYSAEGNLLTTMPLGDGVQDVQTTPSGQTWVSYFDEGIFGGTRFGNAGLANFDAQGVQQFDFNAANAADEVLIADCYALNVVSDEEVWLCPYTDFPLVRLKNRQISPRWDNNPIHGAQAFAVWKSRALFTGGYGERDKLFVVHLDQSEGKQLAKEEHQAVSDDGENIKFTHAFGRGSCLYLVTTDSLYCVDLQVI